MIALGWTLVIGLPLAVVVGVILWPEQIPQDRTVDAIRDRIDREDAGPFSGR
ncbi:hypothetical protein NN3_21780 [Nocardia neocaledoniensis NBRC 108232]|uniref:Uncharacterized protein n=1 Tax=Nocardia neocaledoniensis TaxID=236511 RepID=A0A317NGK1_9NOCA|nr:hypothetical protein [Nocardia neocaledoniensis]PWV72798.1 hypothetical protein DFR69_108110 [Nocardia neocaledoniensis]GEM31171.1 hypothetical protein NN3_21780 [Nocardia neocaledoniensis NBRC 108232]